MGVLRSNSQGSQLDTQVDTTAGGSFLVSAPGLANFPNLISNGTDYYWGVLDPDGVYGAPEVVQVTAHPGTNLATPTGLTVTPTGTTGATTYGYRISAINGLGETLACAEVTTTTGNATLTGVNYNALAWTAVTGASGYKVYGRTAAGELYMATVTTNSYNDTGAATPAGALPASSTAITTMATVLAAQQSSVGRVHLVGEVFEPSTFTAADVVTWPDLIVPGQKSGLKSISDEFLVSTMAAQWNRVDYGNAGAVTWTPGNGMLSVGHTGGDAAQGWHAQMVALGALTPPVTIEAAFRVWGAGANIFTGLVFADGITPGAGKQLSADLGVGSGYGGGLQARDMRNWTGYNAYGSDTIAAVTQMAPNGPWTFIRLVWVSANTWRYEVSTDGVSWTKFNFNSAQADGAFTMTPTYCGLWLTSYGSGASASMLVTFDHFRVY